MHKSENCFPSIFFLLTSDKSQCCGEEVWYIQKRGANFSPFPIAGEILTHKINVSAQTPRGIWFHGYMHG